MRLEDLVINNTGLKKKPADGTSLKEKIITISVTAVVMTVLFIAIRVFTDPFSKNIDITLMGIQFNINDPTGGYEIKEITIKGTYEYYLFKKNERPYYYGYFSVDGYDYTFERKTSFYVPTNFPYYHNSLFYSESKHPFTNLLGAITCKKDFEELFICIADEPRDSDSGGRSWGYTNGMVICAPAQTIEEALEIVERQAENLKRYLE